MEIIRVKINDLIPYEKNAKLHPREQIEQIKDSIRSFGNNDPIAIDEKNIIIEGHGRFQALQELGYDEVECIRLAHLSEEQKKAYILVHNQLTMNTGFDEAILMSELEQITSIDMGAFDFEMPTEVDFTEPEDVEKGNERERTYSAYNMELFNEYDVAGKWQMPIIRNNGVIPKRLIGFNYAKTSEDKNCGIHFFIDDYQFERCWNNPDEYVEILKEYDCVLSPDFSLYTDMSMPVKLWNIYRSRLLGQYWQYCGIKVIPTISWAEAETYEFCFDGIPKGSIVAISTIGVKKDSEAFKIWTDGMNAMLDKIEPSRIICYGGKVDFDYRGIKVIYYDNEVTERMKAYED